MDKLMVGRAETPAQKRALIERLYAAWVSVPALRLGQLFLCGAENALGANLWGMEDADLIRDIENLTRKIEASNDFAPERYGRLGSESRRDWLAQNKSELERMAREQQGATQKHDGWLRLGSRVYHDVDGLNQPMVTIDGKYQSGPEDTISLYPVQALSLLDWLKQEEPELRRLGKERTDE